MSAPLGNKFWEARSTHGANPKFESPDDLWKACLEYFQWVDDHPLKASKIAQSNGVPKEVEFSKMRAMTIGGLCIFLDIAKSTWYEWAENRKDLSDVITRADEIITTQKFEGASADLLNANIIARDLGLTDKKMLGSDPDNPLPPVTQYQLPDNGRG